VSNYLPHIENLVYNQAGGPHHWAVLKPVVEAMTEQQRESFFRTLQNAKDDGRRDGRRDEARHPSFPRFS